MSVDDGVDELRREFAAEIRDRLDGLEAAVRAGDTPAALRRAHTLTGSARALALGELAQALEELNGALGGDAPDDALARAAVVRARRAAERGLATAGARAQGPVTPSAHEQRDTASDVAARLGHDLRTPLNAVLGFAQLLQLSDLTPEQREHVDAIVAAAGRLATLVDDALRTIPRAPSAIVPPVSDATVPWQQATGTSLVPITVLYVEDDPASVGLLEQVLRRRPEVRLVIAPTGTEGLAQAAVASPHLVLLDLELPDLEGLEVLGRLLAASALPPPVVVVSADARPERIAELHAAGAAGFLAKPIDVGELLGLVDSLVAARPT